MYIHVDVTSGSSDSICQKVKRHTKMHRKCCSLSDPYAPDMVNDRVMV